MMNRFPRLLLASAALLSLGACAGGPPPRSSYRPVSPQHSPSPAENAATAQESLPTLERMYKANSNSQSAALRYATALQDAGRSNRALLVLSPFVDEGTAKSNAPLLTEYASIQAALGNYDAAVSTAQKAVAADPQNGTAFHVLGIALDAQGNHPEAEQAFRQALAHWQGNQAPVLNNLGLNLAAQGFIDEAVDTLNQAVALAPDRPEIERNLRIVVALQKQPGTHENKRVPPPALKPLAADHSTGGQPEKSSYYPDEDDDYR